MKRTTHILIGAAVAMPIAASIAPPAAVGAIWLGMVGGGFPDWFDLRSEFKSRLKHRGISHSVFLGVVLSGGLYLLLQLLATHFHVLALGEGSIRIWTISFAAGFLSHVIADACTIAGVQPLLPVSRVRCWVLPPLLRGRSSGIIDTIARVLAIVILLIGVWRMIQHYLV